MKIGVQVFGRSGILGRRACLHPNTRTPERLNAGSDATMTTKRDPTEPDAELRRIVRMLEKTARMAEHATLTGSLSNGKGYAIRSYNAVVEHLANSLQVPPTLFPLLPESASLGDVGIASAQLAEYLRVDLVDSSENVFFKGFFTKGELGEIAEMAREHVLEQLRRKFREREAGQGGAERHKPPAPPPSPPPQGGEGGRAEEPPVAPLWQPPKSGGLEELRTEGEAEAPAPPSAPAAPTPAERRREILEALNAGRLTADEAAARLEAI
jgi:hypothetical protein